jgi:hypothetical protein
MFPLESVYALALAQGINAALILAVILVVLNAGGKN